MQQHSTQGHGGNSENAGGMYRRLLIMVVVSFVAMYVLMYAMVNALDNVVHGVNQAYMAGLMAAAMVIIELAVMWSMYTNRRRNVGIVIASAVALLLCWFGIRQQLGIGNRQFLRSMIPHHAGAILMCQRASIEDPRILDLCKGIVQSQESEIAQMKALLRDAR
jgi:hypothetical protein